MICQCGWVIRSAIKATVTCPQCKRSVDAESEYPAPASSPIERRVIADAQHEHWLKLHRFPFSDDWGCRSRCEWWQQWQASIPNIGCDCRKHWKELVAANPPTFASREAFFAWTVEAHNAVNRRLGKPELTVDEALQLHAPSSRVE